MKDRHSLQTMLGFVAIYALLATFTTDGYYQLILTMVLVWACFGLSWNLLSGYTGLVLVVFLVCWSEFPPFVCGAITLL